MSEQKTKKNQDKSKKIKKNDKDNQNSVLQTKKQKTGAPVVDVRFAKAQYDPKFMAPSAKITKVKIDKRFSKMMNDPSFKNTSSIDRYGRKINAKETNNQLQQYYYMENEQKDQRKNQQIQQEQEEINQEEVEEQLSKEKQEGLREWMQNYDQQSSELEDIPLEQLQDGADVWSNQSEHVIKNDKVEATKRLALCNYDWMNISSKDLMLLFNSFKTSSGFIKSVKVYKSEIGKQKLALQQKFGPQGIWNQEAQQQEQQPVDKKKDWKKSWKQLLDQREDKTHRAFDQEKLRKYEKQRLKYFYAVIDCDSKKTADQIYKQCDGNMFEHSNLLFDLRFIPDDISFDSNNLKEQCNQLPVGGQVKNFINRSLGHSKVNLSWEDPDLSLAASLKKKNWNKLTEEEMDKMDWGMYLNEDEIQQDDNMKKLVSQKVKDDAIINDWKKGNKKNRKQQDDIQITFEGGFDTKKNQKNQKYDNSKQDVPSLRQQQKKSIKQRRRDNQEQRKKKRQHLQLLVDNTKQIDFNVDLNDDRFKAVYVNPSFSIDPVDPKFDHRKVGKVFAEVVKRNKTKHHQ